MHTDVDANMPVHKELASQLFSAFGLAVKIWGPYVTVSGSMGTRRPLKCESMFSLKEIVR